MWKLYLQQGDMLKAFQYCSDHEKEEKARLASLYSDQQFELKNYDKAAKYYALSSKTFEEIALKFL